MFNIFDTIDELAAQNRKKKQIASGQQYASFVNNVEPTTPSPKKMDFSLIPWYNTPSVPTSITGGKSIAYTDNPWTVAQIEQNTVNQVKSILFSNAEILKLRELKKQWVSKQAAYEQIAKDRATESSQNPQTQWGIKRGLTPDQVDPSEAAYNPVWYGFEKLDNAAQGIPTIDVRGNVSQEINDKVAKLPQSEIDRKTKKFNDTRWIQKLYGNVNNYIRETSKSYMEWLREDFATPLNIFANAPASAIKTATATARWVTNPLDTIKGIYTLFATPEGKQALTDRYWSMDNILKTMETDPVWLASDVLTLLEWGANLTKLWAKWTSLVAKAAGASDIAKSAERVATTAWDIAHTAGQAADLWVSTMVPAWFDVAKGAFKGNSAFDKAARFTIDAAKAPTAPLETAGKVAKAIVPKGFDVFNPKVKAQWSKPDFADRVAAAHFGVDAESVNIARQNPEIFKQIDEGKITKKTVIDDLRSLVSDKKWQKSELWALYEDVYKAPEKFNSVEMAKDIASKLQEEWIEMTDGKVTWYDPSKTTLTDTEFSALKSKYNNTLSNLTSKPRELSVEEVHNIRKDIYNTSYNDGVRSKKAKGVDIISNLINEKYLHTVPWFKELDTEFGDVASIAREVSKIITNKDGEFKGTLKALLGEKQAPRLELLEKYVPGITQTLETIKAHDDFVRTRDTHKVWLYGKIVKWATSTWVGFALGGPVWAFIGWVGWALLDQFLSNPDLLKKYIKNIDGGKTLAKLEAGKELSAVEQAKVKIAAAKVQWEADRKVKMEAQRVEAEAKAKMEEEKKIIQSKKTEAFNKIKNDPEYVKRAEAGHRVDKPLVWDITREWKVTAVKETGGQYNHFRVQIDGKSEWMKPENVGGVYGKKTVDTKPPVEDFDETMRKTVESATTEKDPLSTFAEGWKREYYVNSLSEYGVDVGKITDMWDRQKIADMINARSTDKQYELFKEIIEKHGDDASKEMFQSARIAWQTISNQEATKTVLKYFSPEEVSVQFVKSLTTPEWQEARGSYHNKIIKFVDNPDKNTPTHEVLHAYFDMFTDPSRKVDILETVKRQAQVDNPGSKMTNVDAEEWLADNFVQYVRGAETFTGKIKKYFENMWNTMKNIFGQGDKIRNLYNDIIDKKRSKWSNKWIAMFQEKDNHLYEEARKYKSAEEFISNSDVVYHWSRASIGNAQLTPWLKGSRGGGIYTTKDVQQASNYWDINTRYITSNARKFDFDSMRKKDIIDTIQSWLEKNNIAVNRDWDLLVTKYWRLDFEYWKDKYALNSLLMDLKNDWISQERFFTDMWYDLVNLWDWEKQIVVYNPSVLKTKDQLRQIREEANKNTREYAWTHQIDENTSSSIVDISNNTIDSFVSDFKSKYWYPALKNKEIAKMKELMSNKSEEVTIYRASPKNELNPGDWVTIDKAYAQDIKKQNGWRVYKYKVKAKDLYYPTTKEWFDELPSLAKRSSFSYNPKK